jgi:hypothetical protein
MVALSPSRPALLLRLLAISLIICPSLALAGLRRKEELAASSASGVDTKVAAVTAGFTPAADSFATPLKPPLPRSLYHEGEDVTLCWKTTVATSETVMLSECPGGMYIEWLVVPPTDMESGITYKATYKFHIPTSLEVEAQPTGDTGDGDVDIIHSNVHSCLKTAGFCTPFIANQPGLSTHSPAKKADLFFFDGERMATFENDVVLAAGLYTVIAHGRVFVEGGSVKYDVARALDRQVVEQDSDVLDGSAGNEGMREKKGFFEKNAIFVGLTAGLLSIVTTVILYKMRSDSLKLQNEAARQQMAMAAEQKELSKNIQHKMLSLADSGQLKSHLGSPDNGRRDSSVIKEEMERLQSELEKRKQIKQETA